MPSAICSVDGYSTLDGAVNVSPGSSVTIYLLDDAGVNDWDIICFDTDELNDATSITNSIVKNSVAKTATLTFPSEATGSTLLLRSTINRGIDTNGTAQASYVYEFAVCSLTGAGNRLLAKNETVQVDRAYGWIATLNRMIRNL